MNEDRRTQKGRAIISFILAFLLFIALTSVLVSVELWTGFGNKSAIDGQLTGSAYFDRAYDSFEESLSSYTESLGMPRNVTDKLVSREDFKNEIQGNVDAALEGRMRVADSASLAEDTKNRLEDYFAHQRIEETDQVKDFKNEIISRVEGYYQAKASFDFGLYFSQYRGTLAKLVKILLPISAIMGLLVLIVILSIHRPKYKAMVYISYSFLAGVLANIVTGVSLYFYVKAGIENGPDYYSDFVSKYIWTGMVPWFIGTGLVLIGSIGLMLGIRYEREKVDADR